MAEVSLDGWRLVMLEQLNVTFPAKHSLGSLFVAERAFPHHRKWIGEAKGAVDVKVPDGKLLGVALGQVGTEGFSSMSSPDLSRIGSLDFSASFFNEKTAQTISVLGDVMTALIELRLDFLKFSERELLSVRHFQTLETLWLTGAEITDDLLELIVAQENLVNLVLKKTRITDSGIAKLAVMPHLQTLNLPSQITDRAMPALSRFPALRRLDLSFTAITDQGIGALAKMSSLQELYLNDTKLTDASLPHILQFPGLRTLFFSGTNVSDSGLVALESLTNLKHLELRDTRVTEFGLANLRRKLPDCAIFGP